MQPCQFDRQEQVLAVKCLDMASNPAQNIGEILPLRDHFKRFNDDHGHDAGDAVLQAVAAEMKNRFRDGDIVCRFCGEEFTVIAPGTSPQALMTRVEAVRLAIAELNVQQNGRTLGATSMSFGIATWNDTMARDGSSLIQAADTALYQAKREGRNQAAICRQAA